MVGEISYVERLFPRAYSWNPRLYGEVTQLEEEVTRLDPGLTFCVGRELVCQGRLIEGIIHLAHSAHVFRRVMNDYPRHTNGCVEIIEECYALMMSASFTVFPSVHMFARQERNEFVQQYGEPSHTLIGFVDYAKRDLRDLT